MALGRRNYLFAGSDRGGKRVASIYTLVATARLDCLNSETYLRDTLAKIAEGHTINRIGELVPWRMIPATAEVAHNRQAPTNYGLTGRLR